MSIQTQTASAQDPANHGDTGYVWWYINDPAGGVAYQCAIYRGQLWALNMTVPAGYRSGVEYNAHVATYKDLFCANTYNLPSGSVAMQNQIWMKQYSVSTGAQRRYSLTGPVVGWQNCTPWGYQEKHWYANAAGANVAWSGIPRYTFSDMDYGSIDPLDGSYGNGECLHAGTGWFARIRLNLYGTAFLNGGWQWTFIDVPDVWWTTHPGSLPLENWPY